MDLISSFRWKTQLGETIAPSAMQTRHLFLTLRMLWNHVALERYQLQPFKRYALGPRFTPEYIRTAVAALSAELATRSDMAARWKADLATICEHLSEMTDWPDILDLEPSMLDPDEGARG